MNEINILLGYFWTFPKHSIPVDHEILLHKLERYGVRGTVLERFKNYVMNRKQIVNYNFVESGVLVITCSVPQGLVRGPLSFFIYVK